MYDFYKTPGVTGGPGYFFLCCRSFIKCPEPLNIFVWFLQDSWSDWRSWIFFWTLWSFIKSLELQNIFYNFSKDSLRSWIFFLNSEELLEVEKKGKKKKKVLPGPGIEPGPPGWQVTIPTTIPWHLIDNWSKIHVNEINMVS